MGHPIHIHYINRVSNPRDVSPMMNLGIVGVEWLLMCISHVHVLRPERQQIILIEARQKRVRKRAPRV